MINFAVGPVPMDDSIRSLGSEDVPYFRTAEFSKIMLENEDCLLKLANAPSGSRAVFLTASGTGAMEATVMNCLDPIADRAIVVDGGSFGRRFRDMLELHGIEHDAIVLKHGDALTENDLRPYDGGGYTAFLVNLGETSQGILYDADMIADFCSRNDLFLIVDGISSFLADPFDMKSIGADVLITDAQKAIACPPGVAPVVLSPDALRRIETIRQPCMYLSYRAALDNQKRGQTPYTPAVGILLQINKRLQEIIRRGGAESEIDRCHEIASDFRIRIEAEGLPFVPRLNSPSNAVTYLVSKGFPVGETVRLLKEEYGIWVCPNGGDEGIDAFRVGHIGRHTVEENKVLISALVDLRSRGYMDGLESDCA